MNLIKKYIRPYIWMAVLAPLLMLLEVFMDLMQPTLLARIVDKGIIPSDMQVLTSTGILMLVITLIGLLGGAGCSITSTYASTGLARDLRSDLYKKVLSFSHKNINSMETGRIITRLTNDVVQVETMVRFGLRIMVRAPLQVIGSLILAVIISPALSAIFLLLVPVIVLTVFIIMKISNPLFSQVQEKMDLLNTRMQENLAGIRLVKAFVRQDYEREKFSKANDDLIDVNMKASRVISFAHPLMMTFLNMGVLAVIWFGSTEVWTGSLMIGKVIAFINYMMQLLMSLIMISQILVNLSRARASISRLEDLFLQQPDIDEPEIPWEDSRIKGEIEFSDVYFSYNRQSEDPVLKNISFKIAAGEKIALLGATGSGKSTIASLIPRLYNVTSGKILIDGINVNCYPLTSLRKQIGMAPQKTILFSGSIRSNICYGKEEKGVNLADCARRACINEFIESLPEGYDTDIRRRGVNLSGGQKQRIAIARALWGDPPVIILDDSTSAVDASTAEKIQEALAGETDSTVLIITQRINAALKADRILLVEDGEVIGFGTHAELLETSGIYREIYYSQTGKEEVLS